MEAVDVDGVARVFDVPVFQVLGVAGQEILQPVAVDDEVFHGGRATGSGFELIIVKGVAFAVVEAIFADARVRVVSVVHGAVLAEFEEFGVALGFQFFGGQLNGFGFGDCLGVCVVGEVVEAALEEFFGGGETVAGFEVGELALHGVDEELDSDVAVAGFLADDLGELGTDMVSGAMGFGFGLPLGLLLSLCLRLGAGMGIALLRALGGSGAGVVDSGLCLFVAEFDEESCGVYAVAGLEVRELALHGGDEELDDEPAVLGFLGDDVGEVGHIFYFR